MSQQDLRPPTPNLTELELKCLEAFWNRRSAKQIAVDLNISEAWVNKNLASIRRKVHVNSSAEAAVLVFGGSRGGIRNYYYQENALPTSQIGSDGSLTAAEGTPFPAVASERPLINNLGVGQTLGLILLIALGVIVGLLLLLQTAMGIDRLWAALGY